MPDTERHTGILARLHRALKLGRADRRGYAGVEFTLLAPFMIFLILAVTEVFDAMRVSRKTVETSATVADLTSRLTTMTDASTTSMIATAQALMGEHGVGGGFKVTISSIANRLDENGDEAIEVMWSRTNTGAVRSAVTGLTLPTIPVGESVILVEVDLEYQLLFGMVDDATLNVSKNSLRRPRFTNEVVYVNG